MILNNFKEKSFDSKGKVCHGDRWITLTYARKPASFEEAHKNLTIFLKKIKRNYKACKYIAKTEETDKGFLHHHLIISRDVPHDVIAELWPFSNHADDKEIYNLDDLKLSFYFIKNDGSHKCARSKFTHSRNLVKPVIRIRTVLASSWRREPVAKRGYDIYDVQNYFDYFGFEAQEYILKRRCIVCAIIMARH